MERLTEKRRFKFFRPDEETTTVCVDGYFEMVENDDDFFGGKETHYYLAGEAIDKLADYEDAEEQGLLLRLPCKVGDKIYQIPSKVNYDLNIVNRHPENNKVYEQPVYSIQMWNNTTYILNTCDGLDCVRSDSFKETWFLTKAEAEKALAEMEE